MSMSMNLEKLSKKNVYAEKNREKNKNCRNLQTTLKYGVFNEDIMTIRLCQQ